MSMKKSLVLLGTTILLAVILVACGGKPTPTPTAAPTQAPVATEAPVVVPFLDAWKASAHGNVTDVPFRHWDDAAANPDGVPISCAKCHTSAGFVDFAADGKVDNAVPAKDAQGITCAACHSPEAMALTSVTFPSGKVVEASEEGEARCMTCHQGRESKVSVDKQINETFKVTDVDAVVEPIKDDKGNTVNFGFRNVHYFAAGATLYGSQAQMGYEYDGKVYDPKFRHVPEFDTCIACHDQHATKVRVEQCATCHENVKTVEDLKNNRLNGSLADYNGNGDVKEGIYYELTGLQDILYGSIQAYAKEVSGTPIVYDGATYPYFLLDANGDGQADKDDKGAAIPYNKWTARLLKAAYNYQVSAKDPGAFAHNAKYIIELLHDSIEDLNGKISKPVDVTKLARDDAGHFAGNTEPFRHWDAEGEVPAGCAKCHSASGLPEYIHNAGTEVVTKSGVQITGVVAQPVANGFACATCHDTANFPNRLAVVNVPFPSGVSLTFSTEKDADGNLKPVDANLCIECHQGRESTVTVNNYLAGKDLDTSDPKISFKNVHYFAAGATLFGDAAKGAYQYDKQTYAGQNVNHPLNKCTDCHDVHALNVKTDACKACHTNVNSVEDLANIRFNTDTTDWNGNGDTTEGIYKEIDTFRTDLYAAIQSYAETKAGTPILYDANSYPYFFVDANKDGKPDTNDKGALVGYNAWTPRLLKAAYNYQYSIKDPGAFAHNPMYVMQFLYDSIKDLGGDVSKLTRPEVTAAQ
ncbi:MAG TPA: cytochrome c3 family protein [Anaerolineales bacterium]|nr:cytochrome c3 family protein [Anaerolineales bacterium]